MTRMTLVNVTNLSISIGGRRLFRDLTFSVNSGELVAIIGANGCGKSTILHLIDSRINGKDELVEVADLRATGSIWYEPDVELVHLPQLIRTDTGTAGELTDRRRQNSAQGARLFREFAVTATAGPVGKLSDGELQKRVIIAALLRDGDLYLLDEPTNYLDIAGITAFETHIEMLKRKGRGIILVTHDRSLTDNLADRTILITANGIYGTSGGATAAWSIRNVDFRSRSREAREIRKKIKRLEEDARSKAQWASRSERRKSGAKTAKPYFAKKSARMARRSKIAEQKAEKQIENLKKTKPYVPKEVRLRFPAFDIRNRSVFAFRSVWFRYQTSPPRDKPYLLKNMALSSTTRDKMCLMGTNGSGKSTIIKLALGLLEPSKGECYRNGNVNVMHVPQGLSGFFTRELLLDNFSDCGCDQTTIRRYLGAVLIRNERSFDPISSFSYGELMRAAIVKCILMRAEFLFLDEPTSHLDIESIEVLEQLLAGFEGGFMLVSHDRSFVSNVAEKLYALDGGRLRLV